MSDVTILIAACVLAGVAASTLVYFLASRAVESSDATPGDAASGRRRRRSAGRRPRWLSLAAPLLPIARALTPATTRTALADHYARAGWPGGLEDDELAGVSLLVGLLVAVIVTLLISLAWPLAAPVGLLAVAFGPGVVNGWLTRRAVHRDLQITRTMPFVLDLLVLTMRAGAPLNVAMERVAADYAGHPIGMEFRSVLADLEVGVTKSDALENLAQRNPIPAIRSVADDLNQAEELGRPVADALQRLSDRARRRRILEATESAGRAKVLVLLPGMLVFIATLILLFSPFAVRYFYGGYGTS